MTDPLRPTDEPPQPRSPGESSQPAAPPAPSSRTSSTPIGPGLWEALLWIFGLVSIELFGSFVWAAGRAAWLAATGQPVPTNTTVLLQPVLPWMLGSIKLAEVLAAVLAIRLRYGPHAFRATGFRPVFAAHAVILGLAVLPAALLSGQSYALISGYWDILSEHVPWLDVIDKLSSIETVQEMARTTPLAVLVLIIAVLPALNEELIFRAAIGRGLLARYGLIFGIVLTSLLFAALHLSPVHAAALLPLAVLLHVGYLSSGSIWVPVAVHFLNNALSVALIKLSTTAPEIGGMTSDVTEAKFSPILFFSSAACVAATVWLLLKIRVRWRLPDGTRWQPPHPGIEPPPRELGARPHVPLPPTTPLAVAAVCYVLYPAAVVAGIMMQRP